MVQNNGGILGKINTPTTSVASGVWSLDSQFEAQSSSIWPLAFPQTTIANSCRFDAGSSDSLTRTPSGAGNRKTFTISVWFKISKITDDDGLIFAHSSSGSNDEDGLGYRSDGEIFFMANNGSDAKLVSNAKHEDFSAWYNWVVAVDTTQGTASNRVKIYKNGIQVTSFSTENYPSQDYQFKLNNNVHHSIGENDDGGGTGNFFSGYMAEVVMIDGQALDQTSFGATNPVTNIWEPIAYTGTYGTNGFRLDFADSSALGNDVSGNNNDFTVNNLTSIDQSTDTCSNNFCTLNPLVPTSSAAFSEGNLKLVGSSSSAFNNRSQGTFGVQSGKWYFEVEFDSISATSPTIGIGRSDRSASDNPTGSNAGDVCIRADNEKYDEGSSSASYFSGSISAGNIIGVALDMDNGKVWFSKDGTFVGTVGSSGQAATFTVGNGITITPTLRPTDGTLICNFGNSSVAISSGNADANGHGNFEYAPPSGYFALCTKNLAEFG